jgi:CheY-like chemotaxis protein
MEDIPKLAVLIVDDDALVRALAVDIVEDAGYLALEASDADEAVGLLESRPDIAVLFTDINMPGSMDGLKLAHAVRDRWTPVKIIMVSGKVRAGNSGHGGIRIVCFRLTISTFTRAIIFATARRNSGP